jgi:nicotinate-nucleotide adenylyltransferase
MKIGLYFGSFNPIHHGHLIIAKHVLQHTDLQQLWLVVTPHNPLKQSTTLLDEYQRLHLVNLALDGETQIKSSSIEFQLPKPSYTIDTLTYLSEKYPTHQFAVIMGSDSLLNISKWKNPEQLLAQYAVYVYERPLFHVEHLPANTIQVLKDVPMLEISSTYIRQLIKQKKSIRYLLPDKVAEEIEKNNYYRSS